MSKVTAACVTLGMLLFCASSAFAQAPHPHHRHHHHHHHKHHPKH